MHYFFSLALLLFLYMSGAFVISVFRKRNDVADVAWGLGFVLLSWAGFALSGGAAGARGVLAAGLVTVWGGRLAYHIYSRNRGKPEDYRYQAWRSAWGSWFYLRSYLQVYLLQGVLLFLVVSPVLILEHFPGAAFPTMFDLLGALVWVFGFVFESRADAELARFLKDPAHTGMLMTEGLWRYSRHPNYFGEVTQWWGLFIIALSVPYGLYGIIGPATITYLITRVSGIPLLEEKMRANPAFAEYARRTSVFIPLPPRRGA